MSSYPKIYSLSTVGVRQHNNADYLLHALRTDFTGDNGLGKSMIADLMQLIFIPKRDFWKPGTEGIDKQERRIEGIPLNKDFIEHAYAFINIEREKGKFVTVGVFIPKNSRLPVRPFIIHNSPDFESRALVNFDKPLKSSDFVAEDRKIFDLKDAKQHIREKHGLYMEDFFRADQINVYFDILYKNYILPIDITKETSLKAFAKILQSFAKAKTLDVNNSRSLQNFLFEDNDEIRLMFEEQKDQLISYIRHYNSNRAIIRDMANKQNKLLALRKLFEKHAETKTEFFKADAVYASNNYLEVKKAFNENRLRFENASKNAEKNKADAARLSETIFKNFLELKSIASLLKVRYEELLPTFSDEKAEEKRKEANRLWALVGELQKVAPVFKRYKTVKAAQTKLKDQLAIRDQKRKLEALRAIKSFDDFEDSAWAKDYTNAFEEYQVKLVELPRTIEEMKNLLELYQQTASKDSFFHWAIGQKKALSLAQETVLMYLKDVVMKKPQDVETGARFTDNPKALLDSFEEDRDGVWLVLGELREFVPYVTKQKFNDAKTLKSAVDKDREEIKKLLAQAQKENEVSGRLYRELSEIGYNQEFCHTYKNRDKIDAFQVDPELNEAVLKLIEENVKNLEKYDELDAQYQRANDEAVNLTRRQTEIKIELEQINSTLIRLEEEIGRLNKDEVAAPAFDDEHLRKTKSDLLKTRREELETRLADLQRQKETAERNYISSQGIIEGCKDKEKQLSAEMERLKQSFEEKKKVLESETELDFEEVLQLGDFTHDQIRRLETRYIDARRDYEEEFTRIAQSFDETKDHKNPELETDKFNFHTLVNILCGRLGLEGLGPELEKLNEELKKFGDLQLTIILNVFTQVERQFHELKKMVTDLNFFFSDNRISTGYHFRIDFNERKNITIGWISKMRERAKVQRYGADLFSDIEGYTAMDNSPEKLIVGIAQTFSQIKNCDMEDLLNPKFYFDLKVGLYDDKGMRYAGSEGQTYTAITLLCIGRLSIIQRERNRPGIRFIIIEELSNIDYINFNIFPQIAEQFGYQLITMTPKPFGSYSDDSWFLHILVRGKDKDINYQPMSFFKTRNSKKLVEDFFSPSPN